MKVAQFVVTLLFMTGLLLADPQRAAVVLVVNFIWLLWSTWRCSPKHRLFVENWLAWWMLAEAIVGIISSAAIAKNTEPWAHAGEALLAASCVGFLLLIQPKRSKKQQQQQPAETAVIVAVAAEPVVEEKVGLLAVEEQPLIFDGVATDQ